MGKKEVTTEDIIAAMEANGLQHSRGDWFVDINGDSGSTYDITAPIVEACVLGQTIINLGVSKASFMDALNGLKGSYKDDEGNRETDGIVYIMITLNDNSKLSYKQLVGRFKRYMKKYAGRKFTMTEYTYNVEHINEA